MEKVQCDAKEEVYNDSDYRRGYYQGYFQALEDAENGKIKEMTAFLNGELHKWRFETSTEEEVWPPEL